MNAVKEIIQNTARDLAFIRFMDEVFDVAGDRLAHIHKAPYFYVRAYSSKDDREYLYLINRTEQKITRTQGSIEVDPVSLLGDVWGCCTLDEYLSGIEHTHAIQQAKNYNQWYTGDINPFDLDEHEFYLGELTDKQAHEVVERGLYTLNTQNIQCKTIPKGKALQDFYLGKLSEKLQDDQLSIIEVELFIKLKVKQRQKTIHLRFFIAHHHDNNRLELLDDGKVYIRDLTPGELANLDYLQLQIQGYKKVAPQIFSAIHEHTGIKLKKRNSIKRTKHGEHRHLMLGFLYFNLSGAIDLSCNH